MKQRPRIYYTETDKSLMWDRWQKGESLNSIARLFDRHHSAIQGILSRAGGIRPPHRQRSQQALTLAEREEISRGVVAGQTMRSIAASLGRAPSTVSRELNRNGGQRRYRANKADQAGWDRAHRPKTCKLAKNRVLSRIVAEKLQLQWAPEQIAGWLRYMYADNENMQVSHETIYKSLFIQARGALKKELLQHLRKTRAMRRSRHHTQKTADHGRIIDAVSIHERPAEPEVLYYEPLKGGKIRLVGAEYVYFELPFGTAPVTPQHLEGHLLHYMVAPNRFGIPFDWLRLNVWAWKSNPNGTFAGDNPNVSCDAYDPNLHPQP